jgi:hypothetical protein
VKPGVVVHASALALGKLRQVDQNF